jgi:glycine C-acetyltransferase
MTNPLERRIELELEQFIKDGTYKRLNFLDSPQGPRVRMEGRGEVIILSSNNYLGLSNEPAVVAAGKQALDRYGAGTASVRFICGTFTIHRTLEAACARLVGTAASLSFVSAWNANEAVPATLLGENDLVISDQLNHASIIDAIRLAKAITKCQSAVYRHADLIDLDAKLTAARDRKVKMVITDGVFSMDGDIGPLPALCDLAEKYGAIMMVDDAHASGVLRAGSARMTASSCRVAALAAHCSKLLQATEQKVERLVLGSDGKPAEEPLPSLDEDES